ncbi:hypothetical protein PR048_017339 [Dryococelus australis]|uniref:Uncharacterized protein n=1 Tax=Dryococelus australis TaxID=614101 RepID=A0ABQ9H9A7_9NEOP|nr:hypothetical protein PR048_017339 [Dryococelus australis]
MTPESSVTDEVETVRDLHALQRDIQLVNVEERLAEGDFTEITKEELDDDQIISAVLHVLQADAEEDDSDDEDKGNGERISHSTPKEAF